MEITRRSLLFCAAAPAIVRAASLMPVSAWIVDPFADSTHIKLTPYNGNLLKIADDPHWATAQFEAVGAFLYSVGKP